MVLCNTKGTSGDPTPSG